MAECNLRPKWQGQVSYRRSDGVLKAAAGASVTVVRSGTAIPINLYRTHTGAGKANPFILDGVGNGDFYVDPTDCIFDVIVEAPAGEFPTFRRSAQTAAWADLSPWPHDMDADGHMLSRLGQFLGVPMITAYDLDLQDAVDRLAAVATAGAIIVPAGDYDLAAGVDYTAGGTIEDLHLVGFGPDTHIRPLNAGFADDSLLYMSPGGSRLRRFTISDMRLDGRSYAAVHRGLHAMACEQVNIQRLWIHDIQGDTGGTADGDGIRLGDDASAGDECNECNIADVHIKTMSRNGIKVSSGQRIKIRGAQCTACDLHGIEVEPTIGGSTETASELQCSDCTVDGDSTGMYGYGLVVDENPIDSDRRSYKFTNCRAKNLQDGLNGGFGFLLAGVRDVELRGCDVETAMAGLHISNCYNVKVFGGTLLLCNIGALLGTRPAGGVGSGLFEDVENDMVTFTGTHFRQSVLDGAVLLSGGGLVLTEDATVTGTVDQGHIACIGCEFIDNDTEGINVSSTVTSTALRLRLAENVFLDNGGWGYFMHANADLAGVVVIFDGNYSANNILGDYETQAAANHTRLITAETGAGASGNNVGTFV